MKKITALTIIFLLTILSVNAQTFCCKDFVTKQQKCYATGSCCNGYWRETCYDFEVWAAGPGTIRVGEITPISIYIKNKGIYPDSYTISGYLSPPTNLINLDMTTSTRVTDVIGDQPAVKTALVTAFVFGATSTVMFDVTSDSTGITKQANITVTAELPASLPEFDASGTGIIILVTGLLYYIILNGRKKWTKK